MRDPITQKTNYSVKGLKASRRHFYHNQETNLAKQDTNLVKKLRNLNINSGITKPDKSDSLTNIFRTLRIKQKHPPEGRVELHENRPCFDGTGPDVTAPASDGNEMGPDVTAPASDGNEMGPDVTAPESNENKMVPDRTMFEGTDLKPLYFYGMETHDSNEPTSVLKRFETPILLYGGKKRKSKRMKSRYRKKYKGTRNNKTRRYRK
jgi:hypothetical protein